MNEKRLKASESFIQELKEREETEIEKNADLSSRIDLIETPIGLLETAKEGQIDSPEEVLQAKMGQPQDTKSDLKVQIK